MLTIVEKFVFEKFRDMPAWVRVITYLVMLLLFVYLMLLPRFVDGQLVIKDSRSGGYIPYRGAQLQLYVDGRSYKFSANEGGFWSVPIVSRLPVGLEIQVLHEDLGLWFPVTFTRTQLWQLDAHRIEVSDSKPHIRFAAGGIHEDRLAYTVASVLESWIGALVPEARGGLILPKGLDQKLPAPEREKVELSVAKAISSVTGKDRKLVGAKFTLAGPGAPSYAERVRIVELIEKEYAISIPDEHWRAMATAQELVNYVERRVLLNRKYPELRNTAKSWPAIQQSLPPDERPVFRR